MTEDDPEQRAPADHQRESLRQRLHRVLSPVLERARPHVADQEPQHRPAQHVGGKVRPFHHPRRADEEGGTVPKPLPFGKIAREYRGHGKRRRGMPGRKRIEPPLPRGTVFKGFLMRPPRAWSSNEVLENLDSDSRQAMRDEPVDPGLFATPCSSEDSRCPHSPMHRSTNVSPSPNRFADGSQLRDEGIVQGTETSNTV